MPTDLKIKRLAEYYSANGTGVPHALAGWSTSCARVHPPQRSLAMGLNLSNAHNRRGRMKHILMRLWKEEEGQDLIEYALLVALIALGVAAVFPKLAAAIVLTYSDATACMNAPSSTTCVAP